MKGMLMSLRNAGASEVCSDGLAPDVSGPFNAPQRTSRTPESYDLLSLFLVQDVAHIDGEYRPRVGLNVPSDGLSLAGFQVIMYGRFWVITEGISQNEGNGPSLRGSGSLLAEMTPMMGMS